jgi:acid stress-induced BolA-like protein IbaG/YrbA
MLTNNEVKTIVEQSIPKAKVIVDGDGYHYQVSVISEEFEGQSKIKRQQLVYAALGKQIASGELHALTMKTWTPQEWGQNNDG